MFAAMRSGRSENITVTVLTPSKVRLPVDLSNGLAPTLPVLVLAALLGAIGRAAIMPVSQAIVAASFVDARRRWAVSRIQSGGPLAATLGIPLLTAIAAALDWRGAFIVLSGLALAVTLILCKTLCRDEAAGTGEIGLKSMFTAYQPIIRHRSSLNLIVAACLENAGVNAMWTYYGAFYVQQYAFSTEQVGWVSLAAGLGVLIGQTAGGWVGGNPRLLFMVGCAGSGPLIGLSLMLPLPSAAAITLMAAGWVMHGLHMVSAVVLLVDQSPRGRATTLTFYGSATSFGMSLGAALGGLALAGSGYFALGMCTVAVPLAAAILVWFRRPGPRTVTENLISSRAD
jgi:MFS transporter, DHA1 family, inner membrane transport protein